MQESRKPSIQTRKLFNKGGPKHEDVISPRLKVATNILSGYKSYKLTELGVSSLSNASRVDTPGRCMCLLQANISSFQEWDELYSVYQFVTYSAVRALTFPIAIATNTSYTAIEILEEFAGEKVVDLMQKAQATLTARQKEQLLTQVLLEGARMIAMLRRKFFLTNITLDGTLMIYHQVRFAFACFGKLTTPEGTLKKGTKLNLISQYYLAPEVVKGMDKMNVVTVDGIDAESADMYSLGVCLMLMLEQYNLAKKQKLFDYRCEKYEEFLKEVDKLSGKVSEEFFALLRKMLALDPTQRVSAREVVLQLKGESESHIYVMKDQPKHELVTVGKPPEASTKVLEKAHIGSHCKLSYLRSDKEGSLFFVNATMYEYILVKIYTKGQEHFKQYKSLFELAQILAKESHLITTPIEYDYTEDYTIFEWLDESGGQSIEKLRLDQKVETGEASRFAIADIMVLFDIGLRLLRQVAGSLFLSRISRSSILFGNEQAKWSSIRYARILDNEEGVVEQGTELTYFFKLTSAPEVIAAVEESTQVVKTRFKATPADLYALALTIVSLLCDLEACEMIELIEPRCKSSDCFVGLMTQRGVPHPLSNLLLSTCLALNPAERRSPEEVLTQLHAIDVEHLDYLVPSLTPLKAPREELKVIAVVSVMLRPEEENKQSHILGNEVQPAEVPKERKYLYSKTTLLHHFTEVTEIFWKKGGQGIVIKVEASMETPDRLPDNPPGKPGPLPLATAAKIAAMASSGKAADKTPGPLAPKPTGRTTGKDEAKALNVATSKPTTKPTVGISTTPRAPAPKFTVAQGLDPTLYSKTPTAGQTATVLPRERKAIFALKVSELEKIQAEEQMRVLEALRSVKYCVRVYGYEYNFAARSFEVLMEFCDRSLAELKADGLLLPTKYPSHGQLLTWLRQCVEAMATIQDLSKDNLHLYHGDLNPKNILLKDGEVRIADFGCAKIMGLQTATRGAAIEGYTPFYAPPEVLDQQLAAMVSRATYVKGDVFALGVTFLELAKRWKLEDLAACHKLRAKNPAVLLAEVDSLPDSLASSGLLLKSVLKSMLLPDYQARTDFKSLLSQLK